MKQIYYIKGRNVFNLLKEKGLDALNITEAKALSNIKSIGVGEVCSGSMEDYHRHRESSKLFMVRMKGSVQYFDNKMDAKQARDALGGPSQGYYVQRGPGHMGVHGQGPIPRMRRQP